jgi:large-conductance mechanosensitive channel
MIIEFFVSNKVLLFAVFLSMMSGLSIRVMLSLVKQKWASTYHHTMSYTLLPVITFVITTVITGNIALSLGMIGALSIVRFRNPVKNPFELVIFFALITIGISMSVNIKFGLLLAVVINFTILASYIFEIIARFFNINIFSLSFEEGNSNNIIEIQANQEIDLLHDSKLLLQYVSDKKSKDFHYRLASKSREDIERIRREISQHEGVLNIEVKFY